MAIECQLDPTLSRRERNKRIEKVRKKILYWQRRNQEAKRSHRKRRLRQLREAGIDLRKTKRCPMKI